MEYKQLEYFLAACDERSFSRAAERMYISQQGISKAIAKLEKELGEPLFVRTPSGLELTVKGRELEKHARSHLKQWQHIKKTVQGADENRTRELRIGFDIGTLELLPPDFVHNFLESHPQDDIRVVCYNEIACCKLVADRELDVGFALPPVDEDLCETVATVTWPMRVIVGLNHPFAKKKSIRLADLKGQRLCDLNTPTKKQRIVLLRCLELGIQPQILVNASEGRFMIDLCRRNLAVSFYAGSDLWLPPDVVSVRVRDLSVDWGFCMITRRFSAQSELASEFLSYAKARLGQGDDGQG
ncbi:MAG: LysR family transcriptional regulator [Christensenellales bacterium]|jgi:LysR family transcriptional activator of glutamate synthase operon